MHAVWWCGARVDKAGDLGPDQYYQHEQVSLAMPKIASLPNVYLGHEST